MCVCVCNFRVYNNYFFSPYIAGNSQLITFLTLYLLINFQLYSLPYPFTSQTQIITMDYIFSFFFPLFFSLPLSSHDFPLIPSVCHLSILSRNKSILLCEQSYHVRPARHVAERGESRYVVTRCHGNSDAASALPSLSPSLLSIFYCFSHWPCKTNAREGRTHACTQHAILYPNQFSHRRVNYIYGS